MDENVQKLSGWFAGRIPPGWYEAPPEVSADQYEVLIVGRLPDVQVAAGATTDAVAAARSGRIKQHREDTRAERVRIAAEAERQLRRRVSWGARCGDVLELFTTVGLPMMTRLRLPERQVLDALVEAGVARSRSHALAWCVRLVAKHQGEWVRELREAVATLERLKGTGPQL